jgi:hypothetical protein
MDPADRPSLRSVLTRLIDTSDTLAPGDCIRKAWRWPFVLTVSSAVNVSPSALALISLPLFRPEMLPPTRCVLSNLDQSALVVTGGMSWIESRSSALIIACLPTSGMEGSAYETHLNVWRRIALRITSFVTPNSPTRSIILARFAAGFLVASRIGYVTRWPPLQ